MLMLRLDVNATLGFQKLANIINKKPTSLMRMLSDKGNPSIDNMSKLLAAVRQYGRIKLHVSAA